MTRQRSHAGTTQRPTAQNRAAQAGDSGAGFTPRLLPPPGFPGADLAAHLSRHGPLPDASGPAGLDALISELSDSGLTGRGGAAFPAHRKLAAVAQAAPAGGQPVVVGNGAEGEPASAKDQALLRLAPHLVLDGLALSAQALAASSAFLCVRPGTGLAGELAGLIADRSAAGIDQIPVTIVTTPPRFLAGQESALVSVIGGGPAVPGYARPGIFERGVGGRPTYLSNVETLAHLALIARHGAAWFRAAGTSREPGSMLCTILGADGRTAVTEVPLGTPLPDLLDLRLAQAVLVGGYHGTWVPAGQAALLRLASASLRPAGATPGAGIIAALPYGSCGLAETARVARYLALESAGQCGPCLNGLPSIAAALGDLARPAPAAPGLLEDVRRWTGLVSGRGACRHPDGTVRMVASSLKTFAPELAAHQLGRCTATTSAPFLPAGPAPAGEADWRAR